MELKSIIKKVPGARWLYRQCVLGRRRIHRMIYGPPKSELYDIQTVEVMRRALRQDSTCLDVGAHTGNILRQILTIAPLGRHYAVEALPHLAARLKSEFPMVQVHDCAVADKDGDAMFNFVENAPAYSGLQQRVYNRPDPIIKQIPVKVCRIDDLIPGGVKIDLIKCDIEGGEYHAFLGAMKTLQRCKPIVVFECGLGAADYYKTTPDMMFSVINDAGLKLSTMARWLADETAYDRARFVKAFTEGEDYYYIAYP